jgi:6-methylsalicylate decarboxylase
MSHDEALDVHAHFLPTPYLEALRSAGVTTVDNGIPVPGWEVGQAIEVMDQAGIGCGMLSVSSPFLHFLDQAETPALCRTINDSAAEIVTQNPIRFGAIMILPLPDVDASVAEIERAYDTLKLEGVCIPTNARGIYPGDAKMFPVLEELDRRKASVLKKAGNRFPRLADMSVNDKILRAGGRGGQHDSVWGILLCELRFSVSNFVLKGPDSPL